MNPGCLMFKHPFNLMIAGPTSSGKTHLIRDLLSHHSATIYINKDVIDVLWCYGQMQSLYTQGLSKVRMNYHQGLISTSELEEIKPDIIVIDDLMAESSSEREVGNLFTRVSHHLGISVIFIVQNLFYQSKQMRTLSLNSHYIILMKNPRDKLQVTYLGRQIMPLHSKFFKSVYEDATKGPYSNLIIDLHPLCDDSGQLRSWKNAHGELQFIVYIKR